LDEQQLAQLVLGTDRRYGVRPGGGRFPLSSHGLIVLNLALMARWRQYEAQRPNSL
jgi:hypothetical protein